MKKLILYLPFLLFSSYINASVILNPINNSVVISQISSLHNDAVEISASAEFNSSSSLWEYRYLITELNGSLISGGSGAQLVVKEDITHEGVHDEVNFLRDSIFQYDGVTEPGGSTFFSMPHNYSWHPISIPANSAILLGFDDVHAPSFERWQFHFGRSDKIYHQAFAGIHLLPVPSRTSGASTNSIFGIGGRVIDGPVNVPEPISLALLGLGVAGISFSRTKKKV